MLRRNFRRFYLPAANEFTDIERHGVWMNRERLVTRHQEARRNLAEIDAKIMEYVPDDQPFRTYRANGELKVTGINFNPSNFLRWLLFEHLELPVVRRGKEKDDGTPGDPRSEVHTSELQSLHRISYAVFGMTTNYDIVYYIVIFIHSFTKNRV